MTTITPKFQSLLEYGAAILQSHDSKTKCQLTYEARDLFENHDLPLGDQLNPPVIQDNSARPQNLITLRPEDVQGKVRGDTRENNQKRMIHQQAHIESYAIDLSWDILVRWADFRCGDGTLLPRQFFYDWLKVADDEARHYEIWANRLIELGSFYGEFATHDGLWESALLTKHDILARLAIVHLVHEAHGLDCGLRLLNQFLGMRDKKSADYFRMITNDEVNHVAAGYVWFNYIADRYPCDDVESNEIIESTTTKDKEDENFSNTQNPEEPTSIIITTKGKPKCPECPDGIFSTIPHFHHLVKTNFHGAPRPPFNHELRAKAGLSPEWYEPLAIIKREGGEKLNIKEILAQRKANAAAAAARLAEAEPAVTGSTEAAESVPIATPATPTTLSEEKND